MIGIMLENTHTIGDEIRLNNDTYIIVCIGHVRRGTKQCMYVELKP